MHESVLIGYFYLVTYARLSLLLLASQLHQQRWSQGWHTLHPVVQGLICTTPCPGVHVPPVEPRCRAFYLHRSWPRHSAFTRRRYPGVSSPRHQHKGTHASDFCVTFCTRSVIWFPHPIILITHIRPCENTNLRQCLCIDPAVATGVRLNQSSSPVH